jgi:glycosyltransferase 2 family protein
VKKAIFTTLQACVTLAVLFLVFRNPQKRHEMAETIRHADHMWLFVGFAIYGLVEILAGIRWQILLRVQGIRLGWVRLTMLLLIGVFFNYIIPGGTGGDVVKAFYLLKETPGKRSAALLTVLMDRLIGLIALIFLAAFLIAARWSWLVSDPNTAKAVWTCLFILGSAVAGIGFSLIVSRFGLVHKLPARLPGRDRVAEVALAYGLYGKAWGATLIAFALSIGAHIGYFAVFYCPALSFHASNVRIPTFGELCAIMPVVNTIIGMPISIGGVGVREGLFQLFLGQLCGVSEAVAVVMSSAGYLLTMAWGVIGAVVYLFYRPSEHLKLREIARSVAGLEHIVAEEEIAMETAKTKER